MLKSMVKGSMDGKGGPGMGGLTFGNQNNPKDGFMGVLPAGGVMTGAMQAAGDINPNSNMSYMPRAPIFSGASFGGAPTGPKLTATSMMGAGSPQPVPGINPKNFPSIGGSFRNPVQDLLRKKVKSSMPLPRDTSKPLPTPREVMPKLSNTVKPIAKPK